MHFRLILCLNLLFMTIGQVAAWQILPDDGSTKVAGYNTALCILAGGFDNSTIIAQGDNGSMVIVNPQGVSNQTIANRVIMLCRERFGNNITLSSYRYSNYEDYYTPIANIVEALDNIDLLPEFSRDTYDPAQYNYLATGNNYQRTQANGFGRAGPWNGLAACHTL